MSAAGPANPRIAPLAAAPMPVRSVSAGRLCAGPNAGRAAQGPARQGSVPATRCSATPMRQVSAVLHSSANIPTGAVPRRMHSSSGLVCAQREHSPLASPLVGDGSVCLGSARAPGQCLGPRSFSTPDGFQPAHMPGSRPEIQTEETKHNGYLSNERQHGSYLPQGIQHGSYMPKESQHSSCLPTVPLQPNMSWHPPVTARGQERSPSPAAASAGLLPGRQLIGQSPRALAPHAAHLQASPREAVVLEVVASAPTNFASVHEESCHTHRSIGALPVASSHSSSAVTVSARVLHPQHAPQSDHPALYPVAVCFGGSASVPAVSVPARPAQASQLQPNSQISFAPALQAQPSFTPPLQATIISTAAPTQPSFTPPLQATIISTAAPTSQPLQGAGPTVYSVSQAAVARQAASSQAALPTVPAVDQVQQDTEQKLMQPKVAEPSESKEEKRVEVSDSPRDTVWKRNFAGPSRQNHSTASLVVVAQAPVPPREQVGLAPDIQNLPILPSGSQMPHSGVLPLPMQSAGVQICRSESAVGLPETERNAVPETVFSQMPATERVQPSRQAGPSRFPMQAPGAQLPTIPALPQEATPLSVHRHESVRLSEATTTHSPQPSPQRSPVRNERNEREPAILEVPDFTTTTSSQGDVVPKLMMMPSGEDDLLRPPVISTTYAAMPSTARSTGGSLQQVVGMFGAPDPPVAIDMTPLLNQRSLRQPQPWPTPQRQTQQQAPQRSLPNQVVPVPGPSRDNGAAQSFLETAAAAPQQSFVAPAHTSSCKDESFSQSLSAQPQKQLLEVPTPLRSQSTFVSQAYPDAGQSYTDQQVLDYCSGTENTPRFANTTPAVAKPAPIKAQAQQSWNSNTNPAMVERQASSQLKRPVERSQYQQRAVPREEPADALDFVAAAAAAVNLRDLAELRSFRNPPVLVCQVLEPLALLLGETDTRWAKMRKLLDGNLVGRLMSFDPSSLTPTQFDRVESLLQAPAFSDGCLHEKCPAAAPLAAWCDAIMLERNETPPEAKQQPPGHAARTATRNVDAPAPANVTACAMPDLGGVIVEPNVWAMSESELSHVPDLRFTREGVGAIRFYGETDIRDALPHLADIVLLQPGEVVVYPKPGTKPAIGVGLNKAAEITLFGCMPKTQGFRDQKAKDRYTRRVKQMTEDKGAEFVDYDCAGGTWKFRVDHF